MTRPFLIILLLLLVQWWCAQVMVRTQVKRHSAATAAPATFPLQPVVYFE